MHKNSIFVIFGLILLSSPVLALKKAMVKSERALIYADEELTAPLGFVKRGKEVTISENTTRSGKLYRIIVSGRIAFIQNKDLYILNILGNNPDIKKRRKDKFK